MAETTQQPWDTMRELATSHPRTERIEEQPQRNIIEDIRSECISGRTLARRAVRAIRDKTAAIRFLSEYKAFLASTFKGGPMDTAETRILRAISSLPPQERVEKERLWKSVMGVDLSTPADPEEVRKIHEKKIGHIFKTETV